MKKYPLLIKMSITSGGDPCEYYSKGHHDKAAFLDELRTKGAQYEGVPDDAEEYTEADVKYQWWRSQRPCQSDFGAELDVVFVVRQGPGAGAYPVTVVDAG